MADPLAVPRDPAARVEDDYLLDVARAVAAGRPDGVAAPPPGERWVERAVPHGVLSVVLAALASSGHTLAPNLRAHRTSTTMGRLRLDQELRQVASALDGSGIDWVVVKGPVLDQVVYHRRSTRECTDLDLLVPPGQLERALHALAAAGVTVMGADWSQRTWAHGSEVPMLSSSGFTIDLHWHLVNRRTMRSAFDLDSEGMLARRTHRPVGGLEVPTLDDLDLVLHVLLHACLDGCGRLRALLDVQQGITWLGARGVTPVDLAARARQHRVQSPAFSALSAAGDSLDPDLLRWAADIGRVSWWARAVRRWSRRPGHDALVSGLTRRLHRYTAPTTMGSVKGVLGYLLERALRVVSPDRTQISAQPTPLDNQVFVDYVRRVG